jgi:signal transduction histidine kinase
VDSSRRDRNDFDRSRAETIRRRARLTVLIIVGLWPPLMLFADPGTFGSIEAGFWARLPTLGLLLLMGLYARRPRSRSQIETAAVIAIGYLFVTWGRVVVVCSDTALWPAMVSILVTAAILPIALVLSWPATAVLALTGNAAMLIGGLLRHPRPGTTYFYIVATAFLEYPMLVFAAASRDRWQRAELDARTRLREANEQLRRDHEARSRLFVNLSHDFRTPLAVVRSTVELMRRRAQSDPEVAEALDRIDANAASIVDLIDQLLELARLEAGRTPAAPRPCDLAALAREVAARLQPAQPHVSLSVDAAAGQVVAQVDPSHVARIVQNLVGNALRELPPAGGAIRVRISRVDGRPTVDVVDDGPGVPPEMRDRLFQRFATFRREGSTASGIGLALARELAQHNGGDLELLDGLPTTFRLSLPAAEPDAVVVEAGFVPELARRPAPRLDAPSQSDGAAAGKPRLLVVEDNPDLQASLARLLEPRFDVEVAASLAAARASLARRNPAAVLTDLMLPDGDGSELLATLRAGDRFDHVPAVVLSARGEPGDRARGLAAGADDYLAKPFSGDELAARIDAAIRRAQRGRDALARQREDLRTDLHDGVCGHLAVALASLERLQESDGRIGQVAVSLRRVLVEARALLDTLNATGVSWDDLVAHLQWESAVRCESAGLDLDLSATRAADAPEELPPGGIHALRRIAEESITNALRHAGAKRIQIRLAATAGEIRMQIEDDGTEGRTPHRPGEGLTGIKRRAERLGGGARFEAAPTGGFIVEAWIRPFPSPAPAPQPA